MSMKTLLAAAIEAAMKQGDAAVSTSEACRALFSGVPVTKRDDIRTAWYDGIRSKAGLKDGKLISARELPKNILKAYNAARTAYKELFSTTAKTTRKSKAGKVVVTKAQGVTKTALAKTARSPKALASTLKVLVANLQAAEKPQFKDTPKLIAALQVALTLAV
jgi:DNA-binding transcriptional regulator YhcF (GntR family)